MEACLISQKNLHVYRERALEVIINSPDPVEDFVVCRKECDQASEEGPGRWVLIILTKYNVYFKEISYLSISNSNGNDKESSGNQSIFSELLDSEDDVVAICKQPIRDKVAHLMQKDVILNLINENLRFSRIECVDSLLLTLSSNSPHWITAYNIDELTRNSDSTLSEKCPPCFLTDCPSLKFSSPKDHRGMFVIKNSESKSNGWNSTRNILLPTELFSAIFKSEACLLNSSVILTTLNGYVFHQQIKTLSSSNPWQILCSTEGYVSTINHVCFKKNDHDVELPFGDHVKQSHSALLVCSSSGKTCCVYNQKSDKLHYDTMLLPGPIICCRTSQNYVYHSTGHRLYKHSFQLTQDTDNAASSTTEYVMSVKADSELIRECAVDSLFVVQDCKGDVLMCKTPQDEVIAINSEPDVTRTKSVAPQSIKSLLASLEHNNARLDNIHTKQKDLNDFLIQIGIAGQLQNRKPEEQKKAPVTCQCKVASAQNGYSRQYSLVCQLTNQGQVSLSHDWNVMVVMETSNHSQSQAKSHGMLLSQGLHSRSSLEMRIPLDTDSLSSAQCKINVYLCLHSSILSSDLNTEVPESSTLSLTVLVSSQILDIFHFLHESQPHINEVRTKLLEFGKKLQHGAPSHISTGSGQIYSVTVRCDGVKIPEENGNEAGAVSPSKLLRYLLKDSQVDPTDIVNDNIRLVNMFGHSIQVAIETTESGAEVEIKSEHVCLLAECRLAVVSRLKAVCFGGEKSVTYGELKKYLTKLESLKDELSCLQEEVCTQPDDEQGLERISSVYEHLRKIHL